MPGVCTINRTTVYLCSIALAALQFSGAAQAADDPGCICEPPHFASNFSSAQQIFEGRIVTAELIDDQKLKAGAGGYTIRYILTMAHKLDPKSPATNSAEKLSYHGLEVRLNDDKVVSYDWR